MPDQGAHFYFGQKVLAACGNSLHVDINSPAFRLGTFGPDPLFNDIYALARGEGLGSHKLPGRTLLDRMREGILSGDEACKAHAAGFFTHYALDRLCHPDIKLLAATGVTTHYAIESCAEQLLAQQGKMDLPARIDFSIADCRAACTAYRGIAPVLFGNDVRLYWFTRKYVGKHAGKKIAQLPNLIVPRFDGLIAHAVPNDEELCAAQRMLQTLEDSVQLTAEQLCKYFDAVRTGKALDSWCDADFSGVTIAA